MLSFNQVILLGKVGRDPEKANSSKTIVHFSVATSTGGYKKADGTEVPEKTEWHSITAFDKLGDVVMQRVKKGTPVFVCGRLSSSKKDDKTYWEVIADDINILSTSAPQQPPKPVWDSVTGQWVIK